MAGAEPERACLQDRVEHPMIVAVLIGLGRGPHETGDWSAEFRDITNG